MKATSIAAAVLMLAGTAQAVPFSPEAAGWWQAQSTDGTYTELCTASAPCDLPAGTRVTVIDFGTSPATRSTQSVPGGLTGSASPASPVSITRIAESCVWGDYRDADLVDSNLSGREIRDFSCTASCPAGATMIGVTACTMSTDEEGDFETQAADFRRSGEGAVCQRRYGGYPISAVRVDMDVEVACLTR